MTLTNDVEIYGAHAEAFAARFARLIVTAADDHWLDAATSSLCGYGTSVIGCDAEIAVERRLASADTPDGRIGAEVLAFGFRAEPLGRAIANRVGQTVLTCPTATVFDGLPNAEQRSALGDYLRFFGDGHEREAAGHWLVPVMEGEVALPRTIGLGRGVAGGNLILCGREQAETLLAARRAVDAVRDLPGVITPFPGGVCRSGSKVGSRYEKLVASTNEAFCPTLAGASLPDGTSCAYELIFNGVDEQAVREAMRLAIDAAAGEDLVAITAGSYGGKLGSIRIALRELQG